MSLVRICDICGERTGLQATRLTVASEEHPHKGEPLRAAGDEIDACVPCTRAIPDLSTPHTLEDLQHLVAQRKAAAATETEH